MIYDQAEAFRGGHSPQHTPIVAPFELALCPQSHQSDASSHSYDCRNRASANSSEGTPDEVHQPALATRSEQLATAERGVNIHDITISRLPQPGFENTSRLVVYSLDHALDVGHSMEDASGVAAASAIAECASEADSVALMQPDDSDDLPDLVTPPVVEITLAPSSRPSIRTPHRHTRPISLLNFLPCLLSFPLVTCRRHSSYLTPCATSTRYRAISHRHDSPSATLSSAYIYSPCTYCI